MVRFVCRFLNRDTGVGQQAVDLSDGSLTPLAIPVVFDDALAIAIDSFDDLCTLPLTRQSDALDLFVKIVGELLGQQPR